MLEVVQLTKNYNGLPVVDQVSFQIRSGEVLGYLGPNGSGKSTTVKMLTGLLEPTRGQVLYRGVDARAHLLEFQRVLGYVPEEPLLYPLSHRPRIPPARRASPRPARAHHSGEERGPARPVLSLRAPLLAHRGLLEGHEAEGAHQRPPCSTTRA